MQKIQLGSTIDIALKNLATDSLTTEMFSRNFE